MLSAFSVAFRSAKERACAERKATLVSDQGRGGVSLATMLLAHNSKFICPGLLLSGSSATVWSGMIPIGIEDIRRWVQ